jgi:tRNA A58 N-methylase Trm61
VWLSHPRRSAVTQARPAARFIELSVGWDQVRTVVDVGGGTGAMLASLLQFTELARQAGLEVVAAGTQSSGRFVVECRPGHAPPP